MANDFQKYNAPCFQLKNWHELITLLLSGNVMFHNINICKVVETFYYEVIVKTDLRV